MALATQTKILRVLQEGEIQRVGGTETIKVDVRVIAATNKDLEEIVKARTFREDLYYRLNVVRIRMPPLRERRGGHPPDRRLHAADAGEAEEDPGARRSPSRPWRSCCASRWPGNVRELENVIYRSAVIAQGDTILLKDLPPEIREAAAPAVARPSSPAAASRAAAAGSRTWRRPRAARPRRHPRRPGRHRATARSASRTPWTSSMPG